MFARYESGQLRAVGLDEGRVLTELQPREKEFEGSPKGSLLERG